MFQVINTNFTVYYMKKNVSIEQKGKGDVVCHYEPTEVNSIHNKNVWSITVSSWIPLLVDSFIQESNLMKTEILNTEVLTKRNVSIKTA